MLTPQCSVPQTKRSRSFSPPGLGAEVIAPRIMGGEVIDAVECAAPSSASQRAAGQVLPVTGDDRAGILRFDDPGKGGHDRGILPERHQRELLIADLPVADRIRGRQRVDEASERGGRLPDAAFRIEFGTLFFISVLRNRPDVAVSSAKNIVLTSNRQFGIRFRRQKSSTSGKRG